jgi:hypothetical protein
VFDMLGKSEVEQATADTTQRRNAVAEAERALAAATTWRESLITPPENETADAASVREARRA